MDWKIREECDVLFKVEENQSLFELKSFCLLNCQDVTFNILISDSLFYLGPS